MTVYGYLRVSTTKQEETNFKSAILELANQKGLFPVIWIAETVSGRKDWRNRLLGKEFEKMKEGDTIIMAEYSRIGRNFLQSIEFISECRRRKINLIATNGDIPTDDTSVSNLMLAITAYKSQNERELIAYRTKVGLQAAKDKGIKLGRPNTMKLDKDTNNIRKIQEDINNGIKLKKICEKYGVTPPTLRKFIKLHKI
jgi:DNA invertase Pin-like site-specific DNA recombinase